MRIQAMLLVIGTVIAASAAGCRRGGAPSSTESCVPGESVFVGCSSACGIGSCAGDPVLMICDGTSSVDECASGSAIVVGSSDDTCGSLCPSLTVTCPSSGSITIVASGYMGSDFQCRWDSRPSGASPGI